MDELADARRYVDTDLDGFVRRQREARLRVVLLRRFYRRYRCRMSALHELAVTSIALARFAAISVAYDAIGDLLLPVDREGRPKSAAWQAYIDAFEKGIPSDVREERWLAAHLVDMEAVKAAG